MQAVAHAQQQSLMQTAQALLQVGAARRQQLGRCRRRGGAHVGDEIGDRYVGFMPHGTDDWRDAGVHSARHGFFVEAPEVFQRAAATGQDQRVETLRIGQLQRPNDLSGGFAALHGGRNQRQFDLRCAAFEHRDDVADHRAGRRADDADAPRMGGQGGLALGSEQAFAGELFLQCLEGQTQCAIAGRLQRIENQLIVAAAFEQRHLASHAHRQAVT